MFRVRKPLHCLLAGCVLVNYQAAATLKVPHGFESLAEGQKQRVSVDLYGEELGLYEASVSLETIKFSEPDIMISDVERKYGKNEELKKILSHGLSLPLKRNDALSCENFNKNLNCGYINPKVIAAIYDETSDEVHLFVPEKFIPEKKQEQLFFKNAPESHNGFIHQQNLSFVGDRDYQSVSFQGNGTLGIGKNSYANIDWNYNGQRYRTENNSAVIVNNAFVRHDLWRKIYLQGGQMDSRDIFSSVGGNINLSQLQIDKIIGVRVGSSLAWINHNKVSSGTPLAIFISGNSRVDAYRNDKLLESFYLNQGMHKLDTRNFPSGSYTVTLKIYENNQLVRSQDVPFSSIGFDVSNSFQWFLQAGKLLRDQGTAVKDNRHVIVGGTRIPLTKSLSLTAGATLLNNVNYTEGALDWRHGFDTGPLDGTLTVRSSYLRGSDGSVGNTQQLSYNDGFSLSYYRSAMSSENCNAQSGNRYSGSGCFVSSNLMLGVPVYGWNATLGYTDSRNEGHYVYRAQLKKNDSEFGDGAPWETVYMTRSRSRAWQLGLNRSFNWNDFTIGTSLNAFIRRDSSYTNADKGGYISFSLSHTSDLSSSSLSANWNSSRYGERQFGYGASFSHNVGENESGASITGVNTDNINALIYKRIGGQYGKGSLNLSDSYDHRNKEHSPGISGSYSSSVAIDQYGFYWGRWGDGTQASAVTFGIKSEDEDKLTRVRVGVSSYDGTDISANSHALYTVPGYQLTTININESPEIVDGVSSQITKGSGSKKFFMMPGKIINNNVSVESRYTWLGRMVDTVNNPVDDAIPLNVISWNSLGKGGFSLESSHKIKTLYVMRNDEFLQCPVTVKSTHDVVNWIGDLTCEKVSFTKLPVAEKKQVELMTAGVRNKTGNLAALN